MRYAIDFSNVAELTDEEMEAITQEPWYRELQAEAWEDFVQSEIKVMWDYLERTGLYADPQ